MSWIIRSVCLGDSTVDHTGGGSNSRNEAESKSIEANEKRYPFSSRYHLPALQHHRSTLSQKTGIFFLDGRIPESCFCLVDWLKFPPLNIPLTTSFRYNLTSFCLLMPLNNSVLEIDETMISKTNILMTFSIFLSFMYIFGFSASRLYFNQKHWWTQLFIAARLVWSVRQMPLELSGAETRPGDLWANTRPDAAAVLCTLQRDPLSCKLSFQRQSVKRTTVCNCVDSQMCRRCFPAVCSDSFTTSFRLAVKLSAFILKLFPSPHLTLLSLHESLTLQVCCSAASNAVFTRSVFTLLLSYLPSPPLLIRFISSTLIPPHYIHLTKEILEFCPQSVSFSQRITTHYIFPNISLTHFERWKTPALKQPSFNDFLLSASLSQTRSCTFFPTHT